MVAAGVVVGSLSGSTEVRFQAQRYTFGRKGTLSGKHREAITLRKVTIPQCTKTSQFMESCVAFHEIKVCLTWCVCWWVGDHSLGCHCELAFWQSLDELHIR
eukprot:1455990-Rhodomonas_salina.2